MLTAHKKHVNVPFVQVSLVSTTMLMFQNNVADLGSNKHENFRSKTQYIIIRSKQFLLIQYLL